MTNSNEDRLIEELTEYYEILEKLRQDQAKELNKESEIPSKPICLSNLQSPMRSHVETSKDQEKQLLDKVSGLIIQYGKEVLSS
jgi:hypothetical protein